MSYELPGMLWNFWVTDRTMNLQIIANESTRTGSRNSEKAPTHAIDSMDFINHWSSMMLFGLHLNSAVSKQDTYIVKLSQSFTCVCSYCMSCWKSLSCRSACCVAFSPLIIGAGVIIVLASRWHWLLSQLKCHHHLTNIAKHSLTTFLQLEAPVGCPAKFASKGYTLMPHNTHLHCQCIEHPLVLICGSVPVKYLDNSANVDEAQTLHFNQNWNYPNGCGYYIWFRSWLRQRYFWHSHCLSPSSSCCTLVVLFSIFT